MSLFWAEQMGWLQLASIYMRDREGGDCCQREPGPQPWTLLAKEQESRAQSRGCISDLPPHPNQRAKAGTVTGQGPPSQHHPDLAREMISGGGPFHPLSTGDMPFERSPHNLLVENILIFVYLPKAVVWKSIGS